MNFIIDFNSVVITKIKVKKMLDKKICIICNKQIIESSFAKNSEKQYFYHVFCLEKLKLLLKIKKSTVLNSVDFKSLEIIFGVLIDEIPNEMISTLNPGLSEKQQKSEITLDLNKKIQIDIISKAFNMTPQAFIDYVLTKEINYAKYLLTDFSNPKAELEIYYEFEIDVDELKKLILIEAI